MHKGTVSRMRERYAQMVLTFPITYIWTVMPFTRMRDDSDLRRPPNKTCLPKLYSHPNLRQAQKIKCLLRKIFHYLLHTCNTQSSSDSIYCYQSVSPSPSSKSVPSSSSHSLLTIPSSLLPFHNTSPSVRSNALDIQHFLKPFTVTSGKMHCHAVKTHTD